VDASGEQRWIVERLVDHDMRVDREEHPHDSPNVASTRSRRRRAPEKHYRVYWLGHSQSDDTWEPRHRLLEDVRDVVDDYEATLAQVNASENYNLDYARSIASVPATGFEYDNDDDAPVASRGAHRRN
jgi:hypothetical protein